MNVSQSGDRRDPTVAETGRLGTWSPAAVLASLTVAGLVAALVYGRAAGYVYSEDSDWALYFGSHSWYHALSFGQILEQYTNFGHGFYRPTSYFLVPYLLRMDYFQPAEQIALDVATFVVAATMVTLFFPRLRVLTGVVGTLLVLLAPCLYLVTYGVQADSLYIVFGLAFLWLAQRLFLGKADSRAMRGLLWFGGALMFALTVTTKEIGVLAAVLLVPLLLVRGPATFSREWLWRVLRFASPFIAVAIAFGIAYIATVHTETETYSTGLSGSRLLNFINLISWTLGFRSPRHTYTNWVPHWSNTEVVVQWCVLAWTLMGVAVGWRKIRAWRAGVFVLTAIVVALGVADVGGLPYHAFPLVIMYAFAFIVASEQIFEAARRWTESRGGGRLWAARLASWGPGATLCALGAAMAVQGHATYGGVIEEGPQTSYLKASTELFYGGALAPVRNSHNPLLVFNDCLRGLHNPLKFYARASSGSEIVVEGPFAYQAVQPEMQAAYAVGRPVFAALCTGGTDPWYVLRQYAGPKKGLVPATA